MAAPSRWQRLREHKVLQWTLAYFAACLAIGQGYELLGSAFDWPRWSARLVMGVLVVGFPIAVALAWYHGHKGRQRVTRGEMWIVSALVLVGAVILVVLIRDPNPGTGTAQTTPAPLPGPRIGPAKLRLAVLPFENLSPDPANAFFTDGLHEEVIGALANALANVQVISRTTMRTYRAGDKAVAQVAKELDATYVLEGSVRRDADDVRLTLQLIDSRTDDHLWSRNFDRKLVRAMALQSEVAADVASQLSPQLGSKKPEAAGMHTSSTEAYDLYLRAELRAASTNPSTPREELRAIADLYDAAIARDARFAPPHLGQLRVLILQSMSAFPRDALLRKAREHLDAARRIAGDAPEVMLGEAEITLATANERWMEALELFERAEAAGLSEDSMPSSKPTALLLGGRVDDAIALLERRVQADSRNPESHQALHVFLRAANEPVRALEVLSRARSFYPPARYEILRGAIFGTYAGDASALRPLAEMTALPDTDSAFLEVVTLPFLRGAHRYADIRKILDARQYRFLPGSVNIAGVSTDLPPEIAASVHGWASVLMGDATSAKRDARTVTEVIEATPTSGDSAWLWELRRAEAHLFAGRKSAAIDAARTGLARMPRERSELLWTYAALMGASVLAWSGQQDDAAGLLERLYESKLAPAPVSIADPMLEVPLAGNARYKTLRRSLEEKIAAYRRQL